MVNDELFGVEQRPQKIANSVELIVGGLDIGNGFVQLVFLRLATERSKICFSNGFMQLFRISLLSQCRRSAITFRAGLVQ